MSKIMKLNDQQDRNFKPAIVLAIRTPMLALIIGLWEPRLMIAVWFGLSGLGTLAFPLERWMRWGSSAASITTFVTVVLYVAR
jgi:hypothetical protein